MKFLKDIQERINQYLHPLHDRQIRLRVGSVAYSEGLEGAQEELTHLFPWPISISHFNIQSCLNEYEEWLESDECQDIARRVTEQLEIYESEKRALMAFKDFEYCDCELSSSIQLSSYHTMSFREHP